MGSQQRRHSSAGLFSGTDKEGEKFQEFSSGSFWVFLLTVAGKTSPLACYRANACFLTLMKTLSARISRNAAPGGWMREQKMTIEDPYARST